MVDERWWFGPWLPDSVNSPEYCRDLPPAELRIWTTIPISTCLTKAKRTKTNYMRPVLERM